MTDLLRAATEDDATGVTVCVCAAYLPYIPRIGRQPGPMLEDYRLVIRERAVHVVERDGRIVGVLVTTNGGDGFFVDNVAVDPSVAGTGVGRRLLQHAEAEARRRGFDAICLSTHVKMTENQALYSRVGYIPFDHRIVDGYTRVFLRKTLA